MRTLALISEKYDHCYGHFTTRQNIRYNWVTLEGTPDILAELAKVEMHVNQISGYCGRNDEAYINSLEYFLKNLGATLLSTFPSVDWNDFGI